MDVFGTVATTIHLIHRFISYIQAIRSAGEDQLKLLSETSALGAILDILHRRLGKFDGDDDNISNRLVKAGIGAPLDQCCQTLKSTVAELERIMGAGKSSSFVRKMRNLRWPFRQEEIRSILDKIGRLKSLISLALQTSLMEFIESTRDELAIVGLNVERIEAAVSALEERQRAHMREIELHHVDLRDLGFMVRDSANNIAVVKDTVAKLDRNQQDQMMKGDRMLAIIEKAVYGQELQDLVKWLSPLNFSEKHHTTFEKHAPNTGEWFLEHSKFLAWTRGEFQILWCPGNPGVGKSIMASLVVHKLGKEIPDSSEDTGLVFIYFEYKTKYTMTQLAEVILKQLVQRRITQSGLESLRKHTKGSRPTFNELLSMLRVEAETYSRIFFVADALDEADIQVWAPLLEHLRALSRISLLVTSRDTGDISSELQLDQRLDIMANEGDMRIYIEERLLRSTGRFKRLLGTSTDTGLREEIIAGVVKKADGMFLLAQLHMNSLEEVTRVSDLRLALTKLPEDLETAYDKTLGRINNKDKPLAYRIFSWLIHAARPMTIHDLQYALAVEDGVTAINTQDLHDEATLTSVCVGLVVLPENTAGSELKEVDNPGQASSKVVGLVHYTTQEYFLRDRHNISAHLADSPHFAISCLRYFTFDIFKTDGPLENTQKRLVEIPFAKYAMFSWGVHARTHCGDTTVRHLAMGLLHDTRRVVTVGSLPCHARSLSAIHLCTHFGLRDYLECLLDNGFDINSKDSDGDTVVTYAAINGQEETLRLLLARGANVASKGWNGATPLIRAAMNGHQGVVGLLLTHEVADVNWQDNRGRAAIAYAAEHGYSNIAELLRARDVIDINLQDKDGRTPLALAVIGEHEAIVRLLLARNDLNVNLCDRVGNTPTIHAARKGYSGIMGLLLARDDIDVNSQGPYGYTPLAHAIVGEHEAIMRLLLAKNDVNFSLRDNAGDTPITLVGLKGKSNILKLLLAQDGVDVNSRGRGGFTLLTHAILGEHEGIVQLLLERDDLDTSLKTDRGNTYLAVAALSGNQRVAEWCLSKANIDINSKNAKGQVALGYASDEGHETIVKLLLAQEGIDVNPRDSHNHTPLDYAEMGEHWGVIELLRAAGGRTAAELRTEYGESVVGEEEADEKADSLEDEARFSSE